MEESDTDRNPIKRRPFVSTRRYPFDTRAWNDSLHTLNAGALKKHFDLWDPSAATIALNTRYRMSDIDDIGQKQINQRTKEKKSAARSDFYAKTLGGDFKVVVHTLKKKEN